MVSGSSAMVSGSSTMTGAGVLPKGSLIIYLWFVFGREGFGVLGMDHVGVTGFNLPTESR